MGVRLLGLLLCAFSALAGDRHLGPVTDIAVHGKSVYSVSQGGVFLGGGGELKLLRRPAFRVISVAANGGGVIYVGGEPGVSGMVGVLNVRTGKTKQIRVSDDLVYDVAVHGKTAALACADGRILTIQVPGLENSSIRERHRHTAAARTVAFSRDGGQIASAGLDSLVVLSPLKPGVKKTQMQDHTAKIDCLVFSPDGKQIASGARDGKVRIHNLDGRLVRTYLGIASESSRIVWDNNPYVFSLAWGGRPEKLLAGTARGQIYELSLANNQLRLGAPSYRQPIYSLTHEANGRLLIGTHKLTRHDNP